MEGGGESVVKTKLGERRSRYSWFSLELKPPNSSNKHQSGKLDWGETSWNNNLTVQTIEKEELKS